MANAGVGIFLNPQNSKSFGKTNLIKIGTKLQRNRKCLKSNDFTHIKQVNEFKTRNEYSN